MTPLFIVLLIVALALAALWFVQRREFDATVRLPVVADLLHRRGRLNDAIQVLERAAAIPSPFGPHKRYATRFTLTFLYMQAGRYPDAEAECRRLLELRLPPNQEAQVRRRLAQTLEGQNKNEEAGREKYATDSLLADQAAPDAETLLQRAQRAADEKRFAEAQQLYETALPLLTGPAHAARRGRATLQCGLACYNAGDYEATVRYCEQALKNGVAGGLLKVAHNTASIGYTGLGQYPDAQRHREAALELARKSGNADDVVRALALLANLKLILGDVTGAMQLAEEALSASAAERRSAYVVQAEGLQAWGRWNEALAAIERADHAKGLALASHERRVQALHQLARTRIELDRGDPVAAERYLAAAEAEFGTDAKLILWCRAERALLLALNGRPEEAAQEEQAVLAALEERPDDRNTVLVCLSRVAQSRMTRGAFSEGAETCARYLTGKPSPSSLPRVHYLLGECRRGMGNVEGAIESWKGAVATGIDVYYTRRAQDRLQEYASA